jgi:hypothetical protein
MPDYQVSWSIDVFGATDPIDAARRARTTQLDPESIADVFEVIEHETIEIVEVDLSDHQETVEVNTKIRVTIGTASVEGAVTRVLSREPWDLEYTLVDGRPARWKQAVDGGSMEVLS